MKENTENKYFTAASLFSPRYLFSEKYEDLNLLIF